MKPAAESNKGLAEDFAIALLQGKSGLKSGHRLKVLDEDTST